MIYCFMMFYDVLRIFGSLSKLAGLPWFANVYQVTCIHVWNDAGLQWQAAQKPRPRQHSIMRRIGNRIIASQEAQVHSNIHQDVHNLGDSAVFNSGEKTWKVSVHKLVCT